jgi:uncharacterized membrane protein YccC
MERALNRLINTVTGFAIMGLSLFLWHQWHMDGFWMCWMFLVGLYVALNV